MSYEENPAIRKAKDEALTKALDSLGGYKFLMFGYWAAQWVSLNKLDHFPEHNPFITLVKEARRLPRVDIIKNHTPTRNFETSKAPEKLPEKIDIPRVIV